MKHSVHFKDFDSYEDMKKYADEWPNMPAEIEYFEKFFDQRLKEMKMFIDVRDNFTYRDAFRMLRSNTEWLTIQGKKD